jgi:hypothetical protein
LAPVQAFGSYADSYNSACAVGALRLGYGAHHDFDGRHISRRDMSDFGLQAEARARCADAPCPGCGDTAQDETIPHLNDDHRWSRERIADWLEGLGL